MFFKNRNSYKIIATTPYGAYNCLSQVDETTPALASAAMTTLPQL
jgi:hypothetical protein